jgi:aspartyl-tRNA(Asn)/glutamyl-tRNA(Gln) amidotransferase subunit A
MASTVADCAKADAAMAGEDFAPLDPAPLAGLRIGIAQGVVLDRLDETVGRRFPAALDLLAEAGARLSDEKLPLLDAMNAVNAKGGIVPAEAFAVHGERLARRGDVIDPNVRLRIERARSITAADYIAMLGARNELVVAMDARLADIDVLAMPTTPIVAPLMADLESPEKFGRQNALLLRNTAVWNFFDCCAISLPLPRAGGLPVGLMLVARNGHDRRLFRIAAAVEKVFT